MLGRLLRAEGITPSVVTQHRKELVHAMKATIDRLSNSGPQSFQTALESLPNDLECHDNNYKADRAASASMSLLSTAPCKSAFFPPSFDI